MGKYAITAQFHPFSFQERIAPLQIYKQEYDTLNEGLATLYDTANAYQQYVDPESQSGKALAEYNQQLSDVANQLATNGLKGVSRATLYNLRRNYASNISKINGAAKSLAEMHAAYRQAGIKDPTLMVGRMPTVDDLLQNPDARPYSISGDKLYAQAAAAGQSLNDYSPDSIRAAMLSLGESQGISNLGDPSQALAIIQRGIFDGIGARQATLRDLQMKSDIQAQKEKDVARYKAGLQSSLIAQRGAVARSNTLLKAALASGKGGAGGSANMYQDRGVVEFSDGKQTRYKDITAYNKAAGEAYEALGRRGKKKADAESLTEKHPTQLSEQNKINALIHAGIDISDYLNATGTGFKSDIDTDKLLAEYDDILGAYSFMEYVGEDGRNKFLIAPRDVKKKVDWFGGDSELGYTNDGTGESADDGINLEED